MNKRAAAASSSIPPLWHIGRDFSLFSGPLNVHDVHTHSVPVLIAGLYEPFRIRVLGRESLTRAAVVPQGTPYDFDGHGSPVAVIYLEPQTGRVADLRALLDGRSEEGLLTTGTFLVNDHIRGLYEAPYARSQVEDAIVSVLTHAKRKASGDVDPRVAAVITAMSDTNEETPLSLDQAAQRVQLSPSRFQHIFSHEVGVPYRRYRIWQRLKGAIDEIIHGETFTHAAHGAGFADLAHFSREYKRTFGAAPSLTLSEPRRTARFHRRAG